jgi:hypothetical protein
MAALAAGVRSLGISAVLVAALACGASGLAAAADARLAGFRLPVHHRQVNERWLDQFRPWVYGAGFGWQIGNGVATYIKTCGVYLMIVLAALTGNPTTALIVGVVFGLVRGLAVFLGRRITSTTALADFHRRFMAADPVALAAVLATQAAAALTFSVLVAPWLGAALAAILGLTIVTRAVPRRRRRRRRRRQSPGVVAPAVQAGNVTIP